MGGLGAVGWCDARRPDDRVLCAPAAAMIIKLPDGSHCAILARGHIRQSTVCHRHDKRKNPFTEWHARGHRPCLEAARYRAIRRLHRPTQAAPQSSPISATSAAPMTIAQSVSSRSLIAVGDISVIWFLPAAECAWPGAANGGMTTGPGPGANGGAGGRSGAGTSGTPWPPPPGAAAAPAPPAPRGLPTDRGFFPPSEEDDWLEAGLLEEGFAPDGGFPFGAPVGAPTSESGEPPLDVPPPEGDSVPALGAPEGDSSGDPLPEDGDFEGDAPPGDGESGDPGAVSGDDVSEDGVTLGLGDPEGDVPPGDGVSEAPSEDDVPEGSGPAGEGPAGEGPEGEGLPGDGGPVSETGESEKLMTARVDRRSVFAASATASTLIGFADGSATTESGTRRVAVRSTGVSLRSPSSHRSSRAGSALVQADEWLAQDRGCSAVRRSTASSAVPPRACTRTAYVSAWSGAVAVLPTAVISMSNRTARGRSPDTAAVAGPMSISDGTASAIALQHVLRRPVRTRSPLAVLLSLWLPGGRRRGARHRQLLPCHEHV